MLNGFRLFLQLELEGRMLVDQIYKQSRHLGSKQWQFKYSEKLHCLEDLKHLVQ